MSGWSYVMPSKSQLQCCAVLVFVFLLKLFIYVYCDYYEKELL